MDNIKQTFDISQVEEDSCVRLDSKFLSELKLLAVGFGISHNIKAAVDSAMGTRMDADVGVSQDERIRR